MRVAHFFLLTTLFLLLAEASVAQISPGKLAKPHAQLEGLTNCTQCHVLGEEVTNEKCLACHTAIQQRVSNGSGFHASADVKSKRCAECHTDHQGVEFELIHWEPSRESFDHKKTGWALAGAHRKLQCIACHKPALISDSQLGSASKTNLQKTHLGLSSDCKSCHQDEHRGQLGNDCASCHNNEAWVPAPQFSHDKSKFPLAGKHAQVGCEKCHLPQAAVPFTNVNLVQKKERTEQFVKYKELSFSNCTPCHTDKHENKFGQNCKECHTVSGWGQIVGNKFDHNLTKYPLVAKHFSVACIKCHTSGTMTDPLSFAKCSDCHKDQHSGQFTDRADKGACESCHTVEGFKPARYSLEEHNKSRYPLTGSHLAIACFECHKSPTDEKLTLVRFDFTDITCKGCHKDVHGGQADSWMTERGCESCHVTDSWHKSSFDHARTKFPLQGKHATVTCAKCHGKDETVQPAVIKLKNIPLECAACHKDVHQGQFLRAELAETQTDCKRCHTPENWKQLAFDHNKDSRFVIDGAHAKVTCAECHKATSEQPELIVYRPLGRECADCHATTPQKK